MCQLQYGQEEAMLLMWNVPGSVEAITNHGASPPGKELVSQAKPPSLSETRMLWDMNTSVPTPPLKGRDRAGTFLSCI